MRDIFIVEAVRTPIGELGGGLKNLPATQLGAACVRELLERTKVPPAAVEELIFGQVVASGAGLAPGRTVLIRGGLPASVPAFTVNKACGSGMKAVALGAEAIGVEEAELVIAGGMESMSQAPYLLPRARFGQRFGHGELLDANLTDGLTSAFDSCRMGEIADWTAKKYKISRREQDEFALRSHRLAVAAAKKNKYKRELIFVDGVIKDERPRPDTSLEKLAKLKPVFKKNGTVTAGNASGINDGASALLLASAQALKEHNLKPLARIIGSAVIGLDPKLIFITPVYAVQATLKKLRLKLNQIDLIECNEAFAAEMLATEKLLKWDRERVNIYGGAIALGHPIGSSGARIVTTLVSALHQEKKRLGLATICMGGATGMAMVLEKV